MTVYILTFSHWFLWWRRLCGNSWNKKPEPSSLCTFHTWVCVPCVTYSLPPEFPWKWGGVQGWAIATGLDWKKSQVRHFAENTSPPGIDRHNEACVNMLCIYCFRDLFSAIFTTTAKMFYFMFCLHLTVTGRTTAVKWELIPLRGGSLSVHRANALPYGQSSHVIALTVRVCQRCGALHGWGLWVTRRGV